jgi:glutamine cyclotransferase
MRIQHCLWLFTTLLVLHDCGPRNGATGGNRTVAGPPPKSTRLVRPSESLVIPVGEAITVQVEAPDTVTVDSIQVFLGGALKKTLVAELQTTLSGGEVPTGVTGLRTKVFLSGGVTESHSRQITFLSDVAPVEYGYHVVNAYPHDPEAYTQGLQYADGWLYEGTGNYGHSSLRRVALETGEIKQVRNLDESFFGEGITVFGERIYQLTYRSQVGFVYDRESFEEIRRIYYQNREGWGLTNNGEELIMSDGSNVIYFLDPEMFTINRQIEVYNDRGPADSLNELEYIKGKIWANRYNTDEIVIIDPGSGKVEGRINLKGILPAADRTSTTDVLNGIAWDSVQDRIFVTGKYWPRLFEIRLSSPPKSP